MSKGEYGLVVAALFAMSVAAVTAAVATSAGPSSAPDCLNASACASTFWDPAAAVHAYGASVLLLLSAAVLILAWSCRALDRRLAIGATLSFAALAIMASFGALFATGMIPTAYAPLQFLWLSAYLGANGWVVATAFRASRSRAASENRPVPGSPPVEVS